MVQVVQCGKKCILEHYKTNTNQLASKTAVAHQQSIDNQHFLRNHIWDIGECMVVNA